MFVCKTHPLRKRPNSCPDCKRELEEKQNKPPEEVIIKDTGNESNKEINPAVEKILKPNSAITEDDNTPNLPKPRKIVIEESVKPKEVTEEVKVKKKSKESINKEIIKDIDNEILPIIKKEINKLTPNLLDEYINEEFKDKIDKIVSDIYKKAYDKFISEIKSISHVQYEHLTLPMSYFNLTLMNKLQKDGWGFKEILRGDAAKISGFKVDSVIFVRVKNEKWSKAPTLKELKGDSV